MVQLSGTHQISERRNLTVMMVDMVGSTSLSEEYDPEDVGAVLQAYRQICVSHVTQFNGRIVNFIGDGVAACFGWPYANEDDAERAVRAGLGILRAVKELKTLQRPVCVRIGIATGLVVAQELRRDDGTADEDIIGMAPNLASRLHSHAEPDGMLICPVTASLVRGRFHLRNVGPLSIKGLARNVMAFRVDAERSLASRFEGRAGGESGFTLVGRDYQLRELLRNWESVKARQGRMIFVVGEGGIGKSCLVQALLRDIEEEDHTRILLQCSPFHTDTPLYPVVHALRQTWGVANANDDASAFARICAALKEYDLDTPLNSSLMAKMLDLDPLAAGFEIPNDTPAKLRRQGLDLLVAYLVRMQERLPVVIVLEDAHWIDPSTLSLVEIAAAELEDRRILLLVTGRPPLAAPRTAVSTTVSLQPLPESASRRLVNVVAGGRAIPSPILELICNRTDGIPLYIEEVTKTLLETQQLVAENDRYIAAGEVDQIEIPVSLSDVLNSRVDRAPALKNLIQAASCIGREFSADLLGAAVPLSAEDIEQGLESLVQSELIERQAEGPSGYYAFRHFLIQQAAHEMLLKSERSAIHGRIAGALARLRPGLQETQPEELARHLLEAHCPVEALPLFEAAAARSADGSAYVEAVSHLRHALELVEHLDDPRQRRSTELRLLMQIGPALMALRGYADEAVASTYRKALQLIEGLADNDGEKITALFGLWTYYVVSNQLKNAMSTGNSLCDIAEASNEENLLLEAHILLAVTHFARGTVEQSLEHSKAALRIYDPDRHRHHARIYGQEPGMAATTFLALAHWWLGKEAEALRISEEALNLAENSAHPFSMAFYKAIMARLHMLRGDAPAALKMAADAATISDEQLFPVWRATAAIVSGWAHAKLDSDKRMGVQQMKAGIRAYAELGSQLSAPLYEALLLELELELDEVDPPSALSKIHSICERAQESEGLGDYTELMRIEGAILRRSGRHDDAEGQLRAALARADEMSARAWGVRIALELGDLLLETGRATDGLALVERNASHVDAVTGSPILDAAVRDFKEKSTTSRRLWRG